MKIVREVSGYKTSKDYEKLYRLCKERSVVCLCQNEKCTDVAHTIFAEGSINVSARGISYVGAWDKKSFIEQCESYGLEWIIPNALDSPCLLYIDPERNCQALKDHRYESKTGKSAKP